MGLLQLKPHRNLSPEENRERLRLLDQYEESIREEKVQQARKIRFFKNECQKILLKAFRQGKHADLYIILKAFQDIKL